MLSVILYCTPFFGALLSDLTQSIVTKRALIFAAGLICFMILACRDGVGWDYAHYKFLIESRLIESFDYIPFLMAEQAIYWDSVEVFFTLAALTAIAPVTFVCLKRDNALPLICYIALPVFFFESFSVVRQSTAIGFSILAYHYFLAGQRKFIIFSLVAILCHKAASLFAFMLIATWFGGTWVLVITGFGMILAGVIFTYLFPTLLIFLPNLIFYNQGVSFGVLSIAFWILWVIVFFDSRDDRRHYLIIACGVLMSVSLISLDSVFVRLAWFWFIPALFMSYKRIFGFVRVPRLLVHFSAFIVFSLTLFLKASLTQGALIPYQSVFYG